MKAAHLIAGAAEGGAELFFERLASSLARSGDALLPVIRRNRARADRLRQAGLSPVELAFGGGLDVLTRRQAARHLRFFAPRVAVAWMGRAARHSPPGPWVLVGRLGGHYNLAQFSKCDHLVGNTPAIVDWIVAQGWPRARVHRLPNFVPDLAGAAPADLPVPDGARTVLAMGRLHRDKGFDTLIGALAQLPGVHAVIAGDGPERAALVHQARRAGIADRTHFLGWRNDTAALLAACEILVCPSRKETLGNVVLEAFSARKPVVATTADGPAWLLNSGERGILVPAEEPAALSAGIARMLGNQAMARGMAEAGRRHFEAEFAEAAVVATWRHFCTSVEKL